ncbi:MAG: aminoglycoside phosphotransferase family protein [Acidimicrobiia bacterium]|nr:aminoglycoside phosphotransferase family protein [Acidimicrobiia bacterium]MDH5237038.1 aminoglycoside phosphotransferase family protein [Acidimicrobiia bacterium]
MPRSLVHADLINGNVHVQGDSISGVFDWGCALYGDHLYDLAWLEFWSPWHWNLDVGRLRRALGRTWRRNGGEPTGANRRLLACHRHIGLDHLAYSAHLGHQRAIVDVAHRMRTVTAELAR